MEMIRHDIYNVSSNPEDVSIENFSSYVSFSDENYIENYIEKIENEKTLIERKLEQGRQDSEDLRIILFSQRRDKRIPIKKIARRQYNFIIFFTYVFFPISFLWAVFYFSSASDTFLAKISFLITFIGLIVSAWLLFKKINKFYWLLSVAWYKKSLEKILSKNPLKP